MLDGEEGVAKEGMEVCGGLYQLHRDREKERREREEREEREGRKEMGGGTRHQIEKWQIPN